jgi:O-antigen ligase
MRNSAIAAVIAYTVAAAWAPAFWAVSLPGAAILALALVSPSARLPFPSFAPLAMAAIGGLQLVTGATVYRFSTEAAILGWIACAAAAWLGGQADPVRMLPPLAWFSGVIATLAILVHATSTFHIFWIFPVAYPQVFGPYVYRNHYAAFAELMLPVALYLACVRRAERPVFVFIAATVFAAVVVSESRTGTILAAAEIVIVLALAGWRGLLSGRLACVLALALGAGVGAVGFTGLAGRLQEQNPYAVRAEIAKSSLDMWRVHPMAGWGLGTWRTMYPAYARIDPGVTVNEAHNDWAQWACDGGVCAVLAMLALAGWSVRMGVRSIWGLGVSVVFLHASIDYPFQEPSIVFLAMLLAGLMAVSAKDRARTRFGLIPGRRMGAARRASARLKSV